MITQIYALAALLLLVLLTKTPVALAMHKSDRRGYNNRTPRAQQATLTGWGARALAAHSNTFEAMAIFTAAVVASQINYRADLDSVFSILAVVHTLARLAYPIAYIADLHIVRSAIWGIGFLAALTTAILPVVL